MGCQELEGALPYGAVLRTDELGEASQARALQRPAIEHAHERKATGASVGIGVAFEQLRAQRAAAGEQLRRPAAERDGTAPRGGRRCVGQLRETREQRRALLERQGERVEQGRKHAEARGRERGIARRRRLGEQGFERGVERTLTGRPEASERARGVGAFGVVESGRADDAGELGCRFVAGRRERPDRERARRSRHAELRARDLEQALLHRRADARKASERVEGGFDRCFGATRGIEQRDERGVVEAARANRNRAEPEGRVFGEGSLGGEPRAERALGFRRAAARERAGDGGER